MQRGTAGPQIVWVWRAAQPLLSGDVCPCTGTWVSLNWLSFHDFWQHGKRLHSSLWNPGL